MSEESGDEYLPVVKRVGGGFFCSVQIGGANDFGQESEGVSHNC